MLHVLAKGGMQSRPCKCHNMHTGGQYYSGFVAVYLLCTKLSCTEIKKYSSIPPFLITASRKSMHYVLDTEYISLVTSCFAVRDAFKK